MKTLVEIRTWPQCVDLHVIDVYEASRIAHYPLDLDRLKNPVFNPYRPYDERVSHVINVLESDQDFLKLAFDTDQEVKLEADKRPREYLDEVFDKFKIPVDLMELRNTHNLIAYLDKMDLDTLYSFLVEWYDVVESHKYSGYSGESPSPWVERSKPDNCYLFHYLATEATSRNCPESDRSQAYRTFREIIDVTPRDYNLGFLIRWIYYSKAEFPSFKREPLRAWDELQIPS